MCSCFASVFGPFSHQVINAHFNKQINIIDYIHSASRFDVKVLAPEFKFRGYEIDRNQLIDFKHTQP
jgi:hypothetical protein